MKVESYNIFIGIFTILSLIAGAFCGVYFHKGESSPMFTALIVGFVFLCIDYYFIEKRDEIVHNCKVARY